jgi:hypothetical protein
MTRPKPDTERATPTPNPTAGPRYPKVRVRLTGTDGNIYMLIGKVAVACAARSATPPPTRSTPPPTPAAPTTRCSTSSASRSRSTDRTGGSSTLHPGRRPGTPGQPAHTPRRCGGCTQTAAAGALPVYLTKGRPCRTPRHGTPIRRGAPATTAPRPQPGPAVSWPDVLDALRRAGAEAGATAADWWARNTVGGRAGGDVTTTPRMILVGNGAGGGESVRNLPGPVVIDTRGERIGLATGQTRERVHGLPEASVILAKSMPMSAVAGHGGEFGGGSAERCNGDWIRRAAVVAGRF